MYWAQHLQEFSLSAEPLKSLFPEGGFALHGNSKSLVPWAFFSDVLHCRTGKSGKSGGFADRNL